MGLDLFYKNVNGEVCFGYGAFYNYRQALFNTFDDRNLNKMHGFCDESAFNGCKEDCDKCGKTEPWDNVKNNLRLLINHSDCEGELTVEELILILPELEKATEKINSKFKEKHLQLIELVKIGIKNKENLLFG